MNQAEVICRNSVGYHDRSFALRLWASLLSGAGMSSKLSGREPRGRVSRRICNQPEKQKQIVRAAFNVNLWHRWLAEHNERMRNPAVALREKA